MLADAAALAVPSPSSVTRRRGWRGPSRAGVALHEPLALGVGQVSALAARAFSDQHARAVDAGRVELDELHVLQRQAGAEHHRIAVAGAGVRDVAEK